VINQSPLLLKFHKRWGIAFKSHARFRPTTVTCGAPSVLSVVKCASGALATASNRECSFEAPTLEARSNFSVARVLVPLSLPDWHLFQALYSTSSSGTWAATEPRNPFHHHEQRRSGPRYPRVSKGYARLQTRSCGASSNVFDSPPWGASSRVIDSPN
jgi:hypothetical protein